MSRSIRSTREMKLVLEEEKTEGLDDDDAMKLALNVEKRFTRAEGRWLEKEDAGGYS